VEAKRWTVLGAIFIVMPIVFMSASAQIPSLDEQVQQWQQMPENPAMRDVCANDLRWSTEIANRKNHGATVVMLLRWAEQESENVAKQTTDQLMPIGAEMILMNYIQRSFLDKEIYSKISGGFPQWAYRSCLKGKPLYGR
jgi:hypothetical protein